MIMQVHDELVFEVKETELDKVISQINDRMSTIVTLSVPLAVSIGVGDNWDAASTH
jgi:DNA polymerase-1